MSFFKNINVGEYQRIKFWLDEMDIENYTINDDLTVDIRGNVDLFGKDLTHIPIQFGTVSGWFDVKCNPRLTSLDGFPKSALSVFAQDCGRKFTREEIKKHTKVKLTIRV